MSLNIKNPEAHRMARELAEQTGESMASAVTEALRERLARIHDGGKSGLADRLLAIGRACSARLGETARTVDHGTLLYGDDGLPR